MQDQPPFGAWRKKAVTTLGVIAAAPVFVVVAVRTGQAINGLIGPLIPYVVVLAVLVGIYRLVLGRRP